MSKPRILLTRHWPEESENALRAAFDVTVDPEDRPLAPEALITAMKAHDGIACTVTDRLDASVLDAAAGNCRIIANFGVGVNHIDTAAAARHGIVVTNTPGVLTDATADIALTLMLMTCRRAGEGERELRSGEWAGWRPTHLLGREMTGKTLGIIGMGRIGRATARRAALGFGMKVVFYNRSRLDDVGPFEAEQLATVSDVAARADIISLHCPGGEETRHILNAEAMSAMKPDAVVINTARGDVVDEEALAEALLSGRIGGAGLDVFQGEPVINPRLLAAPNTVLLPHLGSATLETRNAMGMKVVRNLEAFFAGRDVPDPVT
ncbi:2-hydroxyacid dehydrogenase [Alphaproteobacteria bacterium LSUCC0684]